MEIFVIFLFGIFLFQSFQEKKITFKRTNYDWCILSLFIFISLNYITHFNSFLAREEWIKITLLILLYYLIVNSIRSEKYIEKFITLYLALALLEAIFALSKKFYLGELRLAGTLASPNFLMGFLIPVLFFISSRSADNSIDTDKDISDAGSERYFPLGFIGCWNRIKYLKTGFLAILFFLTFLCLIFSQSRAGLLLFFAVICMWYFERSGLPKWIYAVIAGSSILLLFSPNIKRFLITKGGDTLSYYRFSIWSSSLQMIKENFWTGVGLGNFKNSYLSFRLPIKGYISQYGRIAQFSHNEFLELGVEIGFIGLIIGGFFLVKYISSFREKGRSNMVNDLQKAGSLIILHSFFDYNLHHPAIMILFIFILASGESLGSKKEIIYKLDSFKTFYFFILPFLMVFVFFLIRPVLSFYETRAGFADIKKKETKSAMEHFQKAIKYTPDISSIHSYLAEAYLLDFQKDPKPETLRNAERYYQQATYFENDNPVFYNKLAFFQFKYYPKSLSLIMASNTIKKSFKLDPYNTFYRFYLGRFHLFRLKFEEAEKYFLQSINIEPYFISPRIYLAFIYKNLGREKELEHIRKEITKIEKMRDRVVTDYEKRLLSWIPEDELFLRELEKKAAKK